MVATHPVRLINPALVALRLSSITSAAYDAENLDGSPSSKSVWGKRQIFEEALPDLLRSHNWNCITKRVQLTLDGDNAPAWGFSFRYLFPTDFLRITEVWLDGNLTLPSDLGKLFRIEDDEDLSVGSLVTEATVVKIRYVYMPVSFTLDGLPAAHAEYSSGDYSVPDVMETFMGKFDRSLRKAVIDRMKAELSYNATGSPAVERINTFNSQQSLGNAQFHDSSDEGVETIQGADDLVDVRL